MGRRRGGGRARHAVASLAAAAVLAAACGGGADGGEPAEPVTIAILRAVAAPDPEPQEVFLDELARAGWAEGERLTIVGRDPGEVHPDPAEAEELAERWVGDGVDLIVALSTSGAQAAARGAPGLPILFLVNDPVAGGLVRDERAPEGNLTGVTFRVPADRTLETARRVLPGLSRVGLLHPSNDPAAQTARDSMSRAAGALQLQVHAATFTGDGDVPAAVDNLRQAGVQAVVLANAPSTVRAFPAIRRATDDARLPVIANTTADFALAVLAPDTIELYRQMARQLVRLVEGESVANVPVEDPARFTFTVNLQAAERLGLTVDERVLDQAEIIR